MIGISFNMKMMIESVNIKMKEELVNMDLYFLCSIMFMVFGTLGVIKILEIFS